MPFAPESRVPGSSKEVQGLTTELKSKSESDKGLNLKKSLAKGNSNGHIQVGGEKPKGKILLDSESDARNRKKTLLEV